MADKKEASWEEKFEKKMKEIEKKVEKIGKDVEKKAETFGKTIEKKAKDFEEDVKKKDDHGHHLFWGIVLLAVGFVWLGNNLDWFDYDIPWVPVALIAGGIYMVIRHWEKDRSDEGDKKE